MFKSLNNIFFTAQNDYGVFGHCVNSEERKSHENLQYKQ